MNKVKLTDFKVGQKAYIELTGNAKRGKNTVNELIMEVVVEKITSKYVIASGCQFKEHNFSYGGLVQNTNYCVDCVLYPNRGLVEEQVEREILMKEINEKINTLVMNRSKGISLYGLRKINEILETESME